eukprot:scaffold71407_cov78-Cyclotella_meneghiniana.AAC.3
MIVLMVWIWDLESGSTTHPADLDLWIWDLDPMRPARFRFFGSVVEVVSFEIGLHRLFFKTIPLYRVVFWG